MLLHRVRDVLPRGDGHLAGALERYTASLRLGSTVPVPELYRAAGTEFRFDRDHVRGLMGFLRERLANGS